MIPIWFKKILSPTLQWTARNSVSEFWVLSFNTKRKFNYHKNLDDKSIVNYTKTKWKLITIWICQDKLEICKLNKIKNV